MACSRAAPRELDWFSRYVVSWELDEYLQLPFVLRAVQRALAQGTPEICNSDQRRSNPTPLPPRETRGSDWRAI
jgi:hypothetical protein